MIGLLFCLLSVIFSGANLGRNWLRRYLLVQGTVGKGGAVGRVWRDYSRWQKGHCHHP